MFGCFEKNVYFCRKLAKTSCIYTIAMYQYIIKKDSENGYYLLNAEGERVATTEILRQCGERRVFAFNGNMGAGKTTFIKQLCEDMGTDDIVNSPTFAIVNVYETYPYPFTEGTGKEEVYHFDCYRIKDLREAMDMGTEEYLYSGNYCFIEWAEMIEALLPEDIVTVDIEVQDNGDRLLTVSM